MRRILLVISAVAFLCLHIHHSDDAISVAAALPFLVFFAFWRPQFTKPQPMHIAGKVFCGLTAIGVCLWPIEGSASWLRSVTPFQRLQSLLGVDMLLLSHIASVLAALAGFFFVFQMVTLFYGKLFSLIRSVIQDFTRTEGFVLLAAALVLMAAVVVVFEITDAFANTSVTRDLIYTSDSGAIVHENAYLSLNALENDFRSPLFALFAAPLMGAAYFIGSVLPIANAEATVLTAAQVPLLVASLAMLMKMVRGVNRPARIALPVMMLTAYSTLLFTVMVEQYVIAMFYLSACLYSLVMHGKREQTLVLGAAGTMITSAVFALLPTGEKKPVKQILLDGVRSGGWVFMLLMTFAGCGLILRAPENLRFFAHYSGASIALSDKLMQYTAFITQIFAAPAAHGVIPNYGYAKWRMMAVSGVSWPGIVIFLLACVGFIINRRQYFAKICMLWVAASLLVLGIIGWGAMENGMTLYTLYFGWAYIALLVYLTESVLQALKLARFSWIVYTLGAAVMLLYNLPRLLAMLRFAVAYYPI